MLERYRKYYPAAVVIAVLILIFLIFFQVRETEFVLITEFGRPVRTVTDAGLNAAAPSVHATNQLEIAVPPDNPAQIKVFNDLAGPGVKLVLCAPAVPCGAATVKVEKAAGVTLHAVSEEQAVTDVIAKVQAGEADAGLVYVTDVKAAGDKVKGIPF